jgi:ribose transport system permease protein
VLQTLWSAAGSSRFDPLSVLRRTQSFIGLVCIVVVAMILSPRTAAGEIIFLQTANLTDVLRQMSIVGIMALAMTFVILTAGIDLSVGSILALSTCVLAETLVKRALPIADFGALIALAVACAIAASTVVGAINGYLIAALRVPPFIITLASMIGIRGFAKWLTSNATIDIGFGEADAAADFARIFGSKLLIIGSFAVLAVVSWILLARTVFGRYVRAIGDNEIAARYSGLPIISVKVAVYTLSGCLAGVAGVLYAAQTNQSDPNAGVSYELDVIAAVVIGGTSLAGGRGSIGGTIVGTLIMGVLTNLLGLKNVDANVQMMIKAAIIILAVWVQRRKSD